MLTQFSPVAADGYASVWSSSVPLVKAIYWYRNEPIADYGRRNAAELVAAGQVEAIQAFIRDLENGARG